MRLTGGNERYLMLETKGHDDLVEVKRAAAERWCAAVAADGRWGEWTYRIAWSIGDVAEHLGELSATA